MKHRRFFRTTFLTFSIALALCCDAPKGNGVETFTSFAVDPADANVEFYWRDERGENFKSIGNVKTHVEKNGKRLRFAMNGGMYQEDGRPLGLFIENGRTVAPVNRRKNARGNFYIEPNGVFYITKERRAFVVKTQDFADDGQINFATQSGPMLVADGEINREFKSDSDNLNVRNGVCVLADGTIFFAISRRAVNFYVFAAHFKNAGCRDALYLDGFVSRMYLPEKSITDSGGDFGAIIAVTEK